MWPDPHSAHISHALCGIGWSTMRGLCPFFKQAVLLAKEAPSSLMYYKTNCPQGSVRTRG